MNAETPLPIAAPEVERRWLVVSAAERRLALGLDAVREVVPARPCTPIPGAPPPVRGLLNLRGRVLTVVELAPPAPGQRVVVVRHDGWEIGLAVDEVLRIAAGPEGEGEGAFEVVDSAALLGPLFG